MGQEKTIARFKISFDYHNDSRKVQFVILIGGRTVGCMVQSDDAYRD
jgi:hypothetical protein